MQRIRAFLLATVVALVFTSTALAGDFAGKPGLPVTNVQPAIELGSDPTGYAPLVVHASAGLTTAAGTTNAFADLDYTWDFGTDGRAVTNPVSGQAVRSGRDQTGPLAAMIYDQPGTYPITLTVRYFDGTAIQSVTKQTSVKVLPWAGQTRVFNPGETADAVFDWLAAGSNRQAVLKRGSLYVQSKNKTLVMGQNLRVVAEDGTGPLPQIMATHTGYIVTAVNQKRGSAGDFSGIQFRDIVLDGNGKSPIAWFNYRDPAHGTASTMSKSKYVYFIGCTLKGFTQMCIVPQVGADADWGGLWGCTLDEGTQKLRSHMFIDHGRGYSVVDCKWFNGVASDRMLDHMIYPNVRKDLLIRWNTFGPGDKSYGMNVNGPKSEAGYPKYTDILLDGNLVTGLQHGIDLGNSGNDATHGHLDRVVIQGCKLDIVWKGAGWQNPPVAISTTVAERLTVRDCSIRDGMLELCTFGIPVKTEISGYRNLAKHALLNQKPVVVPPPINVVVSPPVVPPTPAPQPAPQPPPAPDPAPQPAPPPITPSTRPPARVTTISGKDGDGNDVSITVTIQPK